MLLFEKLNLTFNYVDIGARGELSPPWSTYLRGCTKLIGFEPDKDEFESLQKQNTNNIYFNIGVWNKKEKSNFYLNETESTSSMYPPNTESISFFENKHWDKRVPKKILEVECDTLDNLLAAKKISPDFIKIDTQGAEYKILEGCQEIIKRDCPLILAETWFLEVYKGAETTDQILKLMRDNNYLVLGINTAAAWKLKTKSFISTSIPLLVGIDILFLKKPELILKSTISDEQLMKIICLLEIYGYRHLSLFLIENSNQQTFNKAEIIEILRKNERKERSLIHKVTKLNISILNKLIKLFCGIYNYRVGLHY